MPHDNLGDELAALRKVHAAAARAMGFSRVEKTAAGPVTRLRVSDSEALAVALGEHQRAMPSGIVAALVEQRAAMSIMLGELRRDRSGSVLGREFQDVVAELVSGVDDLIEALSAVPQ